MIYFVLFVFKFNVQMLMVEALGVSQVCIFIVMADQRVCTQREKVVETLYIHILK